MPIGTSRRAVVSSEPRSYVQSFCQYGGLVAGQWCFCVERPNKRFKLSAPSFCGGHRFVKVKASRRSLSAIRYAARDQRQIIL
jgi:hypothetical protein